MTVPSSEALPDLGIRRADLADAARIAGRLDRRRHRSRLGSVVVTLGPVLGAVTLCLLLAAVLLAAAGG